jgi:DNA-directed RNA polymerase subunit F
METIDENLVSWSKAKKILEKKSKEKELGYEQKSALEHLRKFSKVSAKNEEQLISSLKKMEKLKDRHIVILLNLLPQTEADVKVLFANEIINLSEDERKKIASTVKKFS